MAKERCPYSHVQTGDVFHARQEELMNVVAEGTVVETPHVGAKVYIQITNVRTPEQVPSIVTTHFLLQNKDDELKRHHFQLKCITIFSASPCSEVSRLLWNRQETTVFH